MSERYEAQRRFLGLYHSPWRIWDDEDGEWIPVEYGYHYPGGPEAPARAEAARLNALEAQRRNEEAKDA